MTRKTAVIAEIGINHNGSLDTCLRMIDAAAAARCDAVKLQFFKAAAMYPRSAGKLDWKDDGGEYSYDIYEAVQGFELPEAWLDTLIPYAGDRGLEIFASVFDTSGADYLAEKGIRRFKLASYAITHLPLIEHCCSLGFPLVMSTGGANLAEVDEAVRTVLAHHDRLSLLHCSIAYPTPLDKCNLGVVETFRKAYPGLAVGFSDHTAEVSAAPVQTVYLGGTVIEKHITLDKRMAGPDHFFALEPPELARMVEDIEQAEQDLAAGRAKVDPVLYGSSARVCYDHECYLRDFCYMTLFAARPIGRGERIRPGDVRILRPGKKAPGLAPRFLSLLRDYPVTAARAVGFEEPLTWDCLFGEAEE